jgi:hypothetical protein
MPATLGDAWAVGDRIKRIVIRVMATFEDNGDGQEMDALSAVCADAELRSMLQDENVLLPIVAAYIEDLVYRGVEDLQDEFEGKEAMKEIHAVQESNQGSADR